MPSKSNRILTMSHAMAEGIANEMRTDPSVFVMGEDIKLLGAGLPGAGDGL